MAKRKAASRARIPLGDEDPSISQRQWDIAKSSIFASQLRAGGGAKWNQLLATPGFELGLSLEGFLQGIQHSRDDLPAVLSQLERQSREACTLAHQYIVTMRSINPALPQPPLLAPGMEASLALLAYLSWCVDAGKVQPIVPIPDWATTTLSRLHRQIRTLRESEAPAMAASERTPARKETLAVPPQTEFQPPPNSAPSPRSSEEIPTVASDSSAKVKGPGRRQRSPPSDGWIYIKEASMKYGIPRSTISRYSKKEMKRGVDSVQDEVSGEVRMSISALERVLAAHHRLNSRR